MYIIIMLSGHKAVSEAGGDGDRKKRTTDSCAELCSAAASGSGLSGSVQVCRCLCTRGWGQKKSGLSLTYSSMLLHFVDIFYV